ncbi:hypothetical protein EVY07_08840 [Enterobacter hormaechei]|uniref:hypothetical protein n=1 Tax=Enterobacter hormaechei TaxID=158836 RepID=UPI00101C2456|nr:hypothetical protein [Enterobacter hormaechei]EKS6455946.1 hypothetical protein [Enterobacter hormaechei]MDL4434882.1 hypothetical protein [Enterobacter hormaechei]RYH61288.1 hypothetical protein EVY07_08840 [Enterobacter hormaechei]
MSVNRYDIGTFGGMSMESSSDGAYVHYEDYAALKARCAALAAKGMEVVREASLIYSKYNDTQMPDRDIVDQQTLQELYEICTADDSAAFLAEVLAQGVEMLNTQFKKCTGMLYADSVVSTAEHFADQLRKGVQS